MNQIHIWPVVAWKLFQPDDLTVGIMSTEKAQAPRNGQGVTSGSGFVVRYSTDLQGHAGLRVVNSFHGREFGRLKFGDGAGAEVAANHLQRGTDAAEGERDTERVAVKSIPSIAQNKEGMNRSNGKARRDKCSQRHVQHLI